MPEETLDPRSDPSTQTSVEPGAGAAVQRSPTAGAALAVGDQLGRFVILTKLGEGGMAVVYAAYDAELDRKVAIKVVRGDSQGERQSLGQARLLREAQAMARLSHPNIAHVYEVGNIGKDVFIAMEFIQGKTLRVWLQGRPGWREVVQVFLQAGEGLAAAHAAGIVHRDFKPKPSRPPPKASPSAKCRGSPTTGAFERVAVCPGVVRSGQDGPKLAQS